MARVTIDFGNYDTIFTVHGCQTGRRLLEGPAREEQAAAGAIAVPTLVHLGDPVLLGNEVLRAGLYDHPTTFRDLKDHVLHPADVQRSAGSQRVTCKQAAAAFLKGVIQLLARDLDEELDVAFVYPNSDGDRCRKWFRELDLSAARSVALVDEDTALALGHGVDLFAESLHLVLDFGFSSVRARVVQFNRPGYEIHSAPVVRASAEVAYGMADLKLRALLKGAELVPGSPVLHDGNSHGLIRQEYEGFLGWGQGGDPVRVALDLVLAEAKLAGLSELDFCRVLVQGGGIAIPAVRETLESRFGARVLGDSSRAAIGRGGAAFFSESSTDHLVRATYALRARDPLTGEDRYPVVVEKHTRCPTRQPTARYTVNTFYDGQRQFGLEVYRMAGLAEACSLTEALIGPDRRVEFAPIGARQIHEPAMDTPLVIPVQPPGQRGERRFHLQFNVDSQKQLLVSVKDLRENRTVWNERVMVGLA